VTALRPSEGEIGSELLRRQKAVSGGAVSGQDGKVGLSGRVGAQHRNCRLRGLPWTVSWEAWTVSNPSEASGVVKAAEAQVR
jgi:hypothetical protein